VEGRTLLHSIIQDVTERVRAREELRQTEAMRDVSEHAAGIGSFRWPLDGSVAAWSKEVYVLFDVMPGEFGFDLPRAVAGRVHTDDQAPLMAMLREVAARGDLVSMEIRVQARGGERVMRVGGVPELGGDGTVVAVAGYVQDVTGSKQTETLLSVPSEILAILSEGGPAEEMAGKIVDAVQRASGFAAVGLRLRDDDDYPFIAATGYDAGFIEAENALTSPAPGGGLCREEDGSISLECTCGLVIRGPKTPGDPLFTPGGSIWTNDGKAAIEALRHDDPRLRPRNRCIHVGFSSIALVPVRAGDQTLGLLHLADDRTGCFTPESIRFFEGLGASIGNALLRRQAEEHLEANARELRGQLSDMVKAMGAIVGLRDPYTAAHEHRVTQLALAMAERLGMDEERREGIALAGEVHDIGKVSVPAEILTKPSRLTAVEFTMISLHAEAGRDILSTIKFRQPVADIVAQHHERLDGSGYPQGLRGDDILPEAKILAVADVVEAMASHRPYRPGLGLEAALAEVRGAAGLKYDAAAVEACEQVFAAGFSFPEA
jgi:putative nucleotidyltransferase with HDIG domain